MTARSARTKETLSSSGTRKSRSFAMRVSSTATTPARITSLASRLATATARAAGVMLDRDAPRDEEIAEQREEDEQLDRGRPLDEGQVAAGVLEDHRLVDHRELEVRGRVVDGQAPGLGQGHDEERAEREQVAGAQGRSRSRHGARHDLTEVGGARAEGEREDREGDGGLGEGSHGHLAAGSHAAERRARVEPGQREEEGAEQEKVDDDEQVADPVERRAAPRGAAPGTSPPPRWRRR